MFYENSVAWRNKTFIRDLLDSCCGSVTTAYYTSHYWKRGSVLLKS